MLIMSMKLFFDIKIIISNKFKKIAQKIKENTKYRNATLEHRAQFVKGINKIISNDINGNYLKA